VIGKKMTKRDVCRWKFGAFGKEGMQWWGLCGPCASSPFPAAASRSICLASAVRPPPTRHFVHNWGGLMEIKIGEYEQEHLVVEERLGYWPVDTVGYGYFKSAGRSLDHWWHRLMLHGMWFNTILLQRAWRRESVKLKFMRRGRALRAIFGSL
jgi:hypothetical protein